MARQVTRPGANRLVELSVLGSALGSAASQDGRAFLRSGPHEFLKLMPLHRWWLKPDEARGVY